MLSKVGTFIVKYMRKVFKLAKLQSQKQFFLLRGTRCRRWSDNSWNHLRSHQLESQLFKYTYSNGCFLPMQLNLRASLSFCACSFLLASEAYRKPCLCGLCFAASASHCPAGGTDEQNIPCKQPEYNPEGQDGAQKYSKIIKKRMKLEGFAAGPCLNMQLLLSSPSNGFQWDLLVDKKQSQ